MGWAFLADALPIYPLYALFFADHGLTDGQISALFAIWSATAVIAEVPTGALADRYSRRYALAGAGLFQAAGYLLWLVLPGFAGFAVGFILWGIGGALASGALEALLYDGLADSGAQHAYARVYGWVSAAELVGQIPAALAATVLFPMGGYGLVGWVSVVLCLAASSVALRLPDTRARHHDHTGSAEQHASYRTVLKVGLLEAVRNRAVRDAGIAVALVTGIDAIEEYFALLAHDWGIATHLTPIATLGIPLAGAAGAAVASRARQTSGPMIATSLGAAGVLLALAAILHRPAALAVVAAFYGIYRFVLVAVGARLQERIKSDARATVASVAGLATELSVFAVYAAWALGGVLVVALTVCLSSLALAGLLRDHLA